VPGASTKAYATIRGLFSLLLFAISSVNKHFLLVSAHDVITIAKWESKALVESPRYPIVQTGEPQ
jgi:hypothetical protein